MLNGAIITLKSNEQINVVRLYKKDKNGKYILFYVAKPQANEVECKISNSKLSSEESTEIKIVIEDQNGQSSTTTKIDRIQHTPVLTPDVTITATPIQTPVITTTQTATPTVTLTQVPTTTPTATLIVTQTPIVTTTTTPELSPSTTQTPIQTPIQTATPTPTSTPTPSGGNGPYSWPKSGSVVKKYSDDSIQVSVEKIGDFYVSKIWVKDPSKQVKKASASWGKNLKKIPDMLNPQTGAIVGTERKWILSIRFLVTNGKGD